MVKFVHARMPGRDLIHLVPAEGLSPDERFGDGKTLTGKAMTLCGKRNSRWIIDKQGKRCERCWKHRR